MIATIHKGLTSEKWNGQPMEKRILNIVSELIRAKGCLVDQKVDHLRLSLERVLELMDLTTDTWSGERSYSWRKEFLRLREVVSSFYVDEAKALPEIQSLIHAFLDMEPSCHNLGLQF